MKTAFVFTGQGSQFAGMGQDLADHSPAARATFEEADAALGESLSMLCFEGPEDQLALTENTQPATLTVSIAAYRAVGQTPDLAAGHSLGEYSALTAAGAFEFTDALRLVRERARRMQEAVPAGTGGMVVLRKIDVDEARRIAEQASERGACDVANLNAPGQIVLSGEVAAMDAVVELVGPRKALRLAVSVPFHSSLLEAASKGFAEVLRDVEIRDPAFPIYCNVDARPVTDAASVRDALERQFARSVLWQATVERMIQDEGVGRFVEFGPKPTLARLVTQIANGIGVDGIVAESVTIAEDVDRMLG